MLSYPIAFAPGTEAQASAAEGNYQEGQVSITTQNGRRMRVGLTDGTSALIGWPMMEDDISIDPAGGGYASPSSAVLTSGDPRHLAAVTLAAYSGAYTHKLLLPATEASGVAVLNGTMVELQVTVPNSANPTFEMHNETSGGTLLWSVAGDAAWSAAHVFVVTLLRKSGAWVRWKVIENLG